MKVMVNARYYGVPFHQAKFRSLLEYLIQLSSAVPLEWIYFITDIPEAEQLISANKERFCCNNQIEKVPEKTIGYISLKIWYDLTLNQICKKHHADVLIHGDHFCSLSITIPQIIVTDGILKEYAHKLSFWERILLQRRWSRMISKTSGFLCWSSVNYDQFIRSYPALVSRSLPGELIPLASIQAISWEEKQAILNQYTQGVEFFMAMIEGADAPALFMDLLKGYSWFKKRFHSNMKLVVFGAKDQPWLHSVPLESYKYRNDIILSEAKLYIEMLPAAYAMAYMSKGDHLPMAILEALQSGIPVIATKDTISESLSGDAVAWKNDTDPEQWGHLMGELYKDEIYRKQLINSGFELTETKRSRPAHLPFQEIFT